MKLITHLIALLVGAIAGCILCSAFFHMTRDGATLPSDVTIAVDTQEVAILRKGTIVTHDKLINDFSLRFSLRDTQPSFHEGRETYYMEKKKDRGEPGASSYAPAEAAGATGER